MIINHCEHSGRRSIPSQPTDTLLVCVKLFRKNSIHVLNVMDGGRSLQGYSSGQTLGWVDFDLVVPRSAQFYWGSCKLGRNGIAVGQDCGTLKSTKSSF